MACRQMFMCCAVTEDLDFQTQPQQESLIMNLQSQIALVTGANRGIGRTLVQALLKAGVKRVDIWVMARVPARR